MQATFDADNNLVINHRRYDDFFSKKSSISKPQAMDGALIQANPNVAYYEPEYRDFIEDYFNEKPGFTRVVHYYTQQVFWDHVVVTKRNNIVIFESDDASHSSYQYCIKMGYVTNQSQFAYIQQKDKIKDEWARRNDIKLVRIPYTLSWQQKAELINKSLENY